MNSEVTLKNIQAESCWLYLLEAHEDGNSTANVFCFEEKNKPLRGFVLLGTWEYGALFDMAERASQKIQSTPRGQKNLSASSGRQYPLSPVQFKATREGDQDLYKVVLTSASPSQCWRAWNSGSGSPRNFILYMSWSGMESFFESLLALKDQEPEQAGFVEAITLWDQKASLDNLELLPKKILQSARENLPEETPEYRLTGLA